MRARTRLLTLLLSVALPLPAASACSIPVFRYALERWEPAPCQALVFHRGPPDADALRLLADLEDPGLAANLTPTRVDVTGLPLGRLHPRPGEPPYLVVRTAQ